MRKGHPEVCLYRPEIPQNVGNIGRLCAATQCRMHVVTPVPFSVDDRNLRRPGLDYWPFLDLEIHHNFENLLNRFSGKVAFFSARSKKIYTEMPADIELLVFGQETKGLPKSYHEKYFDNFWNIPIFHPGVRSLNVANSVSIVLYHQLLVRLGRLQS